MRAAFRPGDVEAQFPPIPGSSLGGAGVADGGAAGAEGAPRPAGSRAPSFAAAVGPLIPGGNAFISPLPLSFANLDLEGGVGRNGDLVGVKAPTMINGCPGIRLSKEELNTLALPLSLSLVGKFLQGRPKWDTLVRYFKDLHLLGHVNLANLDPRHCLISMNNLDDYARVFAKGSYQIGGHNMRISKWTRDFKPNADPSLVPIWLTIPSVGAHMYTQCMLFSIAGVYGKPLKMDYSTAKGLRGDQARVLVELDLLKSHPQFVVMGDEEDSVRQPVMMEQLPKYCTYCKRVGHEESACFIQHPHLKTEYLEARNARNLSTRLNRQGRDADVPGVSTVREKDSSGAGVDIRQSPDLKGSSMEQGATLEEGEFRAEKSPPFRVDSPRVEAIHEKVQGVGVSAANSAEAPTALGVSSDGANAGMGSGSSELQGDMKEGQEASNLDGVWEVVGKAGKRSKSEKGNAFGGGKAKDVGCPGAPQDDAGYTFQSSNSFAALNDEGLQFEAQENGAQGRGKKVENQGEVVLGQDEVGEQQGVEGDMEGSLMDSFPQFEAEMDRGAAKDGGECSGTQHEVLEPECMPSCGRGGSEGEQLGSMKVNMESGVRNGLEFSSFLQGIGGVGIHWGEGASDDECLFQSEESPPVSKRMSAEYYKEGDEVRRKSEGSKKKRKKKEKAMWKNQQINTIVTRSASKNTSVSETKS